MADWLRAPKGAMFYYKGMYYKEGTHHRWYRFNNGEWCCTVNEEDKIVLGESRT